MAKRDGTRSVAEAVRQLGRDGEAPAWVGDALVEPLRALEGLPDSLLTGRLERVAEDVYVPELVLVLRNDSARPADVFHRFVAAIHAGRVAPDPQRAGWFLYTPLKDTKNLMIAFILLLWQRCSSQLGPRKAERLVVADPSYH